MIFSKDMTLYYSEEMYVVTCSYISNLEKGTRESRQVSNITVTT